MPRRWSTAPAWTILVGTTTSPGISMAPTLSFPGVPPEMKPPAAWNPSRPPLDGPVVTPGMDSLNAMLPDPDPTKFTWTVVPCIALIDRCRSSTRRFAVAESTPDCRKSAISVARAGRPLSDVVWYVFTSSDRLLMSLDAPGILSRIFCTSFWKFFRAWSVF